MSPRELDSYSCILCALQTKPNTQLWLTKQLPNKWMNVGEVVSRNHERDIPSVNVILKNRNAPPFPNFLNSTLEGFGGLSGEHCPAFTK